MHTPDTILVADDDRTIRRNLVLLLQSEGFRTLEAADGIEALSRIRSDAPDAVLLDLKMPRLGGLELLAEVGPALADLPVIVVTALGGSAAAIEAMRRGAYDYLTKPFDLEEVMMTLRRALKQRALAREVQSLRAHKSGQVPAADEPDSEPELIGKSAAMREVFKLIGLAAATDAPVLILGESGTGKELVATALHRHSNRSSGPFIRVNCGALPEGLIESELFGHERGAFTGAERQKPGRFERADGGTIFLDEIAELPLPAQAKILRVLQQREFERLGGTTVFRSDARVISATHRDLAREVSAGRFREDLFYRINVARIVVPALRDRPEDVPLLADAICAELNAGRDGARYRFLPKLKARSAHRSWPGNVRQLENVLARAVIAARGRTILPDHLDADDSLDQQIPSSQDAADMMPLRALLAEVERRAIQRALPRATATAPRPPRSSVSAAGSCSTKSASTGFNPEIRRLKMSSVRDDRDQANARRGPCRS